MEADQDHDGKISFEEFTKMVENTDVSMSMTLGKCKWPHWNSMTTPVVRKTDSHSSVDQF